MKVKWFSALLSPWHLWSLKVQNLGLVVIAEVGTNLRFCFYQQVRENRALDFGADVGRGHIKYVLNLFFSITKKYPECVGFREH